MDFLIEEISFKDENSRYLDVTDHIEKYCTLKLNDEQFDFDLKDWNLIKQKIDILFKQK